jgi:hypothetical protein
MVGSKHNTSLAGATSREASAAIIVFPLPQAATMVLRSPGLAENL